MRLFLVLGLAVPLLFSPCAPADAADFSDIYVFGNSLSDNGNIHTASFTLLPPPPYYAGRFSNGPVYAEVLADLLGLGPLQPAASGGTNYAWGGALSGTDIAVGPLTLPSVRSQVIGFLASPWRAPPTRTLSTSSPPEPTTSVRRARMGWTGTVASAR